MLFYDTRSLLKAITKCILRTPVRLIPEGKLKFSVRRMIFRVLDIIPEEFLANPGDIVVLVGFHRIDNVMRWSYFVGEEGRVIVIEAVPEYVENLRVNIEHHLNWPYKNITFINKGVDSCKCTKKIEIGKHADYNKLADQGIQDGLSDTAYTQNIEIETDTLDNILLSNKIDTVNHIEMTISGMEVEALKGMSNTLLNNGLRIQIRSLHEKNGQLLYPQVVNILEACNMRTLVGCHNRRFKGREIFASRLDKNK